MTLTREDIVAIIGPVEDVVIAEIIGMGATSEELVEAYAWLTADEALMGSGRPLPASRVGRLIEILEAVDARDEEL